MNKDINNIMPKISAAIVTLNDEENLPYLLESVYSWTNEIIIVDRGSNDKTLEIARQYNAKIYINSSMELFSMAKKEAIKRSLNEYVLLLDTDEIVTKSLALNLLYITEKNLAEAVFIPRATYLLGEMLDCNFLMPDEDTHLRFFKKDAVDIIITTGDLLYINPLNEKKVFYLRYQNDSGLIHFTFPDPSEYIKKFNEYYNMETNEQYMKNCFKALNLDEFIKKNLYFGIKNIKINEKEFLSIRLILSKILYFLNAEKSDINICKEINLKKYHSIASKFIDEYKSNMLYDYNLFKFNMI